MKSKAKTVAEYLESLPEERGKVIGAVRKVIRTNLPKGYQESMSWGVISYEIPLSRYPDTYNGKPLMMAGLAAQKNNYTLYLMCVYSDPKLAQWLGGEFEKIGKKLAMGTSCVRFKKLDDLPLAAVGKLISRVTVDKYLEVYERTRKK
jgi:hypothetical protein